MAYKLHFTKMNGIGNDYIYVDCTQNEIRDPGGLSQVLSDRHYRIGADGLILIMKSGIADFRMRMFNADGSEGKMCGNGIRCVGKYVYDNGLTSKTQVSIETRVGIKLLDMQIINGKVKTVSVDMGEPILNSQEIPVLASSPTVLNQVLLPSIINHPFTCISMGNPHAVFFVEEITDELVTVIGKQVSNETALFTDGVNVEFARLVSRNEIVMRVWERGSGETMACGTGACAVLVAGCLNGLTDRQAVVQLNGGSLEITWKENNHVHMEGTADKSFEGVVEIEI